MEVLKLLSVLWRRAWIIALATAFFLGVAIVATLLLPEEWTAQTAVMVDSDDTTTSLLNDLGLQEMAQSLTSASSDIENRMYLAMSPPVVEEVIWRLQLRNKKGELYLPTDLTAASLAAPLFGTPTLTVTQTEGTDVIVIQAIGPSPQTAQMMSDTVADVYIEQQTHQAREQYTNAEKFIREQLAQVQKELDDAFEDMATAQRDTQIIDLDNEVQAAVNRLSDLYMTQEETFAKIEETQARISQARKQASTESVQDGVSATTMQQNPIIGQISGQLAELRAQRAALMATNYTDKSPEVKEIDAKIAAGEKQLTDQLAASQSHDPTVEQLQADLAGLYERQKATQAGIDQIQQQWASYPDKMRQFSQLKLAAGAAENVYRSLQDQRYQIGIAQAMQMSDIRVTAPAALPTDRSSPKTILNVLAGLILGLGFGVVSALAYEYLDDTILKGENVREAWELSQLGALPRMKPTKIPALATVDPSDPLNEAYRALRNSLEFASVDKPIQILGVTSSAPGEGKSTVVMNLAVSMANEGRRVLVVDADLRLPTQHRQFPELVQAPGLVEILARSHAPGDAVQATTVPNLFVLASGALPQNPGHLVESLRMRQVLLELGRGYDVVLVDTPPVLAVNDPIVLARQIDGLVLVVEAHKTTKRMLAETRARFDAAKLAPLGFVLNKVRAGAAPYSRYTKYYQKAAQGRRKAAGGGAA